MRYDWDEDKRQQNVREHGIDFSSVHHFEWDWAVVEVDDREDYGELREVATGFGSTSWCSRNDVTNTTT